MPDTTFQPMDRVFTNHAPVSVTASDEKRENREKIKESCRAETRQLVVTILGLKKFENLVI
jgi:hypothetical protein